MTYTLAHLARAIALCVGVLTGWAAGSDVEAWSPDDQGHASSDAISASYSSTPTAPRFLQKP
jgi:hypothetical protein